MSWAEVWRGKNLEKLEGEEDVEILTRKPTKIPNEDSYLVRIPGDWVEKAGWKGRVLMVRKGEYIIIVPLKLEEMARMAMKAVGLDRGDAD